MIRDIKHVMIKPKMHFKDLLTLWINKQNILQEHIIFARPLFGVAHFYPLGKTYSSSSDSTVVSWTSERKEPDFCERERETT